MNRCTSACSKIYQIICSVWGCGSHSPGTSEQGLTPHGDLCMQQPPCCPYAQKHGGVLVETLWAPGAPSSTEGIFSYPQWSALTSVVKVFPFHSEWDSTMAWTSLHLWRLPKTWHHPHRPNHWMWPNCVLQQRGGTCWGCGWVNRHELIAMDLILGSTATLYMVAENVMNNGMGDHMGSTFSFPRLWGLPETHALIVRAVCLLKSRLCMRVAQGDDTTLLPIDHI